MFNYHYEKIGQTYWKYIESESAFTVRAQKDINIGEPVSLIINIRYVRIMVRSLIIVSFFIMGSQ